MKTFKEISENLAILGIFSKDQLDKHDINYWWEKKYKDIFASNIENKNEFLINLNSAKENLDKIEYKELMNCFKSESKFNEKQFITKKDDFGNKSIKTIYGSREEKINFFKKFKKFVKNTRQDRIYKEGKVLPDIPENLKTFGIPFYGIPIEDIKKTIKEIKQAPQEKKKSTKKNNVSKGQFKSQKSARYKNLFPKKHNGDWIELRIEIIIYSLLMGYCLKLTYDFYEKHSNVQSQSRVEIVKYGKDRQSNYFQEDLLL